MTLWTMLPVLAAVSLLLTWILRRYALSTSLLDVPNARSSHAIPTPRGGGVAIVLTFLAALPLLAHYGWIEWPVATALIGSGCLVAVVGFLDDHGHIAARWRLLAHFAGSAWLLVWLDGLPAIWLFGFAVPLGWLGYAFFAVFLVWLLNLFNFMDGIDGIASVEAITVCLGGALLAVLLSRPELVTAPLVLATAVSGFLWWNFPPAKIFMGDAGSGFLGMILGGLLVQAALQAPELLWGWLILLGVFIVDATFTLLRRLFRGEKVHEAHRSHAYQRASRQVGGHRPVTLAVLLINFGWLLPWAIAVALGWVEGVVALFLSYLPLVVIAVAFKAGEPDTAGS